MRGAVRPHEQSGDDAAEFSKKRAAVSEERPESSDEGAIDGAGGVDLTRTDRGETRVLTGFILNCDDKKKKVSFKLMTREEPNDWHARVRVGDGSVRGRRREVPCGAVLRSRG